MSILFTETPILGPWLEGSLIPGQNPGSVALLWPHPETVLSVQPDGTYQTRSRDAIGAWESARRVGDKLVYLSGGKFFIIPIVEI